MKCWSKGVRQFNKVMLFSATLIFLTMISCQSDTDKYRVSQIDTVSYRMEEMAKVYFEIDTAKINSSYQSILINIDKLNRLPESNNKNLLMDYGTLKKGFKEFIKSNTATLDELDVCRKQIKDLRDDTANGLYSDDEFELYFNHEANASQNLRVQMSYYHSRIASQMSKFESLNPGIERLIDSLTMVK